MSAALFVLMAWTAFAATHFAFGLPPLRGRLVQRLGEYRFVACFSLVAALTLAGLAVAVAVQGDTGAAGPALGGIAPLRWLLGAMAFFGVALAVAGLLNYMRSPMALFRTQIRSPAGIERVTRHAFFMGLTLFAVAHALLASTLATSLYFSGFAAMAWFGAWIQDRKLLARHGSAYADYVRVTSVIPFAALLDRRQSLMAHEALGRQLALCAAIAALMFATHPLWSALHGAPLAGVTAIGGGAISLRRWLHARRSDLRPAG